MVTGVGGSVAFDVILAFSAGAKVDCVTTCFSLVKAVLSLAAAAAADEVKVR